MNFRVELICLHEDGSEDRCDVIELDRHELAMETLGLKLEEGKAIVARVQEFVAAQQVTEELERQRKCPNWGSAITAKAAGQAQSTRCSGQSRCRIRGGTGVRVRPTVQRRSGPPLPG